MSRIPIRLRLTLAFAIAMAIVLAATGAFVYFRVESSLDEAVDEGLEERLQDAAALARAGERTGPRYEEEGFTEIIAPGQPSLASPEQLRAARAGGRVELDHVGDLKGNVRIKAGFVETEEGRRTVVVGAALGDRNDALRKLLAQLIIVAPIALLLSSALGYWLSRAALRPVDEMRAEAAAISGEDPGRRLHAGPARDEIARLAETLNAMLARLERAIQRERSFVADASHELRTPLALMKTELDLALRKPRTAPELEEALRSAEAEADRLARLAEDLLVLAQADDGRLPLRRDDLRAADLFATVQHAFQAHAEASGRTIQAEPADGVGLSGDRLRLEQALGNLVDNALRHGAGDVRLSALDRNGSVELHVVDQGQGFPPDFLPHAFERFGRADDARTSGGAGLGLALAAAIAQAHRGSAHAANREGGGADVWLAIPKGA
jgi:two-component system, OmpR family, sensor kinase